MGKKTPSQAKNDIKTCFRELIDPSPTPDEIDELWIHFGSRCAYCDVPLDKNRREGQLDHLVSKFDGGLNHISNRALACGPCNGDQKREQAWDSFILAKAPENVSRQRIEKIQAWTRRTRPSESEHSHPKSEALARLAEELAQEVCTILDKNIGRLRAELAKKRS